jgi:hypothetical protein
MKSTGAGANILKQGAPRDRTRPRTTPPARGGRSGEPPPIMTTATVLLFLHSASFVITTEPHIGSSSSLSTGPVSPSSSCDERGPILAAALDDVSAGSAVWINGRFFSGTAAFAIRCMSSGRTLPVPVISATHNATSCASSALLALPADAGTGPFSLTVKTSSGTSTAAVLGAPAVDWASAYIAAQSVHRRCHSAVYGRNLATLLHPTVELMAVDGELEQPRDDDGAAPSATTATITDLTETRACFESPSSLVAGTHSVKLCGFIGGTASGSSPTAAVLRRQSNNSGGRESAAFQTAGDQC